MRVSNRKDPSKEIHLNKREKYIRNTFAVLTHFFFIDLLFLHYTTTSCSIPILYIISWSFLFFFLCIDTFTFFVNNLSTSRMCFFLTSFFTTLFTQSGNPKVGHQTCTPWTQSRASSITSPTIITNHAILLVLSDQHQAADLKEAAIRFINKNAPAVMMMPSWPAFSKNHQNLLVELYRKLLE